jgi:hypothetical protein
VIVQEFVFLDPAVDARRDEELQDELSAEDVDEELLPV